MHIHKVQPCEITEKIYWYAEPKLMLNQQITNENISHIQGKHTKDTCMEKPFSIKTRWNKWRNKCLIIKITKSKFHQKHQLHNHFHGLIKRRTWQSILTKWMVKNKLMKKILLSKILHHLSTSALTCKESVWIALVWVCLHNSISTTPYRSSPTKSTHIFHEQ